MKKLLLIIGITFFAGKINAQTSDSVYNKIYNLNFQFFAGKPVGQFIDSLPTGYSEIGFVGQTASNRVRLLYIKHSDGSKITIYVKKFNFMNPIDANRVWNLNLFKKESLYYVSLEHYDYDGKDGGQ
jgi:hypothetical protein